MWSRLTQMILGLILLSVFGGVRWYMSVDLTQNVTGHLKRAGDANTVELATKELETAITHLERNGLTSGYTSILYRTPDEDIGFWYQNLKSSLQELKAVRPDASQLERSNILLKLRETLLDTGKNGTSATIPEGLSVYPANKLFAFFGCSSLLLFVLALFAVVSYEERYGRL